MLIAVAGGLLISLRWERDNDPPFSSPVRRPDAPIDATQGKILGYISQHPGVHLRQICRELGLAMGDVQYHVHRLEKDGRVSSTRRGLYRFFYPSALFGDKQRDILSVLTLDTPRELLLHMMAEPGSSQDALVKTAGVSQPTVSWHLKRLIELGIVQKEQVGRTSAYRVAGGSAPDIALFMMNYHPTVWERWSSRMADIFITYSDSEQRGEKPKE